MVVLRKIDVLCEDHFAFISDYIKHDVPFAELCNDMINTYYDEVNLDINLDIEFNDGCAFNLNAFMQYITLPQETYDAYVSTLKLVMAKVNLMACLGSVVKGYANRIVASKNVLICNAKELYEFCKEKLEVKNSEVGKMLNRLFFFVLKDDIAAYQENFPPSGIYKHIPGTRKIHQLINQPLSDSGVYKQCFSCLCEYCLSNEFSKLFNPNGIYLKKWS